MELKHVEKVFALTTEDGKRLKTKQMMATRAFATAEVDANARAGGGVARDAWARVVAARAGDGDEQKGRYLGALSPPLPATAHGTGLGPRRHAHGRAAPSGA